MAYLYILGDHLCVLADGHEGDHMKTRGLLYFLARLLGDVQAVKKGTVGKRVIRRATGKATGKGFRKLFK